MKTCEIMLSSIEDVKKFVNLVNTYEFDVDLVSGRYVVDAKSIMGIFSLDLLSPVEMTIHCDNCDDIVAKLKDFIVE